MERELLNFEIDDEQQISNSYKESNKGKKMKYEFTVHEKRFALDLKRILKHVLELKKAEIINVNVRTKPVAVKVKDKTKWMDLHSVTVETRE